MMTELMSLLTVVSVILTTVMNVTEVEINIQKYHYMIIPHRRSERFPLCFDIHHGNARTGKDGLTTSRA